MFRMTDEEGNILAEGEGQTSGPFFAAMDPLNPLYSYQLGSAITPYWLALLQQTESFSSHKKSPNVFRNETFGVCFLTAVDEAPEVVAGLAQHVFGGHVADLGDLGQGDLPGQDHPLPPGVLPNGWT